MKEKADALLKPAHMHNSDTYSAQKETQTHYWEQQKRRQAESIRLHRQHSKDDLNIMTKEIDRDI